MRKKLILSILIAAAMLAAALALIDRQKFVEAMSSMRPAFLLPVVAIVLAGQVARALRWWLLVGGVRPAPFRRIAPICFVGFMAINVFPLRTGEVVRPLLLKGREGLPFASGLATVVAERVVDALAVFAMLMVSLAILPSSEISLGGTVYDLRVIARLLLLIFAPMALFLGALVVMRGRLVALVERVLRPVSPKVAALAARVLGTFVEGLEAFQTPVRAAQVVVLTVAIWTLQCLSMGVGFQLFGLDVPLRACIPVLAITMAGITVPAGIGMAGNFQLFCVAALALWSADPAAALAYSVVMNVVFFAVAVVMGLCAMPFVQVRLGSLVSATKAS